MSEPKHTPGPWRAAVPKFGVDCDIFNTDAEVVATAWSWPDEEHGANAALIAASPVMYTALKMVAEYHMGDDDLPQEIADAINNALSKARGEP